MIRFENVKKVYDNGTRAIKGISLLIGNGEFVFLVGPSGSGKSTILNMLTGEEPITSGTIVVDGFDLTRIKANRIPYLRRKLGVVFQDIRLIQKKTVEENLEFAMRVVGAPQKAIGARLDYVLDLVGLADKKRCYPNELSGGEQQRVAIARALASGARVILADEPTGNLDTANGDRVMEILQRLAHEEGYCVVVVTHDMSIAEAADQVLRMKDGVLAEQETA